MPVYVPLTLRGCADWQKVAKRSTRPLYPYELFDIVMDLWPEGTGRTHLLEDKKWIAKWEGLHHKYREDTYKFIRDKIIQPMIDQRKLYNIPDGSDARQEEEYDLEASDRE